MRALSQLAPYELIDHDATRDHGPPDRRDAGRGRPGSRRVPRHRLARGQRVPQGERRRSPLGREGHRSTRIRPEPGGAEPRHPPQRVDRGGHHGTRAPAVQRSVLPPPHPGRQRGPVRPGPAARPADARRRGRRAPHRPLSDGRPRRRRHPRQPPRRRPAPHAARQPACAAGGPGASAEGRRRELRRRRQPGRSATRDRPSGRRRPHEDRHDHRAAGHGRRHRPARRLSRWSCRCADADRRGPHRDRRLHPGRRRARDGAAPRRNARTSMPSSVHRT